MTAAERRLVRESYASLAEGGGAEAVLLLFYGRLFNLAPELRGMFNIDMRSQAGKLRAMFDLLMDSLDSFDALATEAPSAGCQPHATTG